MTAMLLNDQSHCKCEVFEYFTVWFVAELFTEPDPTINPTESIAMTVESSGYVSLASSFTPDPTEFIAATMESSGHVCLASPFMALVLIVQAAIMNRIMQ